MLFQIFPILNKIFLKPGQHSIFLTALISDKIFSQMKTIRSLRHLFSELIQRIVPMNLCNNRMFFLTVLELLHRETCETGSKQLISYYVDMNL